MKEFIKKNSRKKKVILITIAFIGVSLFFVLINGVSAADTTSLGVTDAITKGVGTAVATVLSWVAWVFLMVFGLLLTLLIQILVNVAGFNNIIDVAAVTNGWVIVRDLCNMFFILILLVVAFATILRIESYQWKKILPKLLIMAVLINFSRTICGLIIDFGQVIMLTFVNGFSDYGPANFINMFQTKRIAALWTGTDVSSWGVVVGIITGVIALIITNIVVIIMLAVLIVRVIMLWVYTILSPIAFLAAAFPAGQKYASQWWSEFSKQVVVGPVLAFFIWLALTTAQQSSTDIGGSALLATKDVCAGLNALFCTSSFQTFIITIGLLIGGLMVTQQMGGMAASIAGKGMDWAKKVGGAPLAAAGGVAKFGFFKAGRMADTLQMKGQGVIAKGVSRLTGGVFGKEYQAKSLNYRMVAEGWKRNQAVKMRDYEGTKAGAWQDQFNRTLSASFGVPVVSRIMESRAGGKINNLENGVIVNGEVKERGKLQINEEIGGLKNKKESAQTDEERAEIQKSIEAREGEIRTINKKISDLRKVDWRIGKQPLQKFARLEEQQKANEEYTNIGKEDINEEGLVNKFETEGRIDKKRGYLMRLADINGINTLFADMGEDMTADNMRKFYEDQFGAAAGDVAAEVSRRAEAVGNYKLMGFHKFDVAKNRNVLASPEEQENYAMRKDKERYAQNHGRTTHFDSLVDRYADGRKELSSMGARQLLQIASNEGRMKEIENGNYQTRYGEMVIELKPQIENKIQEFKASGKIAEAAGLQKVLGSFVEYYGKLKFQKEQEKAGKENSENKKKEEKTNEAEDKSSSD